MVALVRELFYGIYGSPDLECSCIDSAFEGAIDATDIWTGEPR
jgi:hypothetical protein